MIYRRKFLIRRATETISLHIEFEQINNAENFSSTHSGVHAIALLASTEKPVSEVLSVSVTKYKEPC